MGRYALDATLSDLSDITATVNHPVSEATRENPSLVTLTMESGRLQQILTAASLHMSDTRFVPKPEVGEHASIIAENNRESQDWHYLMEDAIEVATARASAAAHPNSHNDRERSVVSRREFRAMQESWDKEAREKAEATDPNTKEGIEARWDALNPKKMDAKQTLDLMIKLMEKDTPLDHEVAVRLFESYRVAQKSAEEADERVKAARKILGASY